MLSKKNYAIDVILLCETFLTDALEPLSAIPGYKMICNNRPDMKGGGTAILIKEYLSFKQKPELELIINKNNDIESCIVEVKLSKSETMVIGEIYCGPNTSESEFIDNYDKLISSLGNTMCIIGHDFNIDYFKLNTNKNVERFLDSNLNNAFFPSILLPTRVAGSTNTLIDNIHIKDKKCRRYSSNVIIDDISDYFPCILSICFNQQIRKEEPLYVLKCRLNDNAIFSINKLLHENWKSILQYDVNTAYDVLLSKINNSLN